MIRCPGLKSQRGWIAYYIALSQEIFIQKLHWIEDGVSLVFGKATLSQVTYTYILIDREEREREREGGDLTNKDQLFKLLICISKRIIVSICRFPFGYFIRTDNCQFYVVFLFRFNILEN